MNKIINDTKFSDNILVQSLQMQKQQQQQQRRPSAKVNTKDHESTRRAEARNNLGMEILTHATNEGKVDHHIGTI